MIQDVALRWVVTLLFLFSAGVCIAAIAGNRHSAADRISHSLHAIMAIAMAVMAWPRGAEIPSRAPMIFFAIAALWFVVVTVRTAGHRGANVYHTLMMAAMAWMYAVMGGLPLPRTAEAMAGMPGMDGAGGHAGHGAHAGHGGTSTDMQSGADPASWVGVLNWVCLLGFAAASAYWLYRLVTARLQPGDGSGNTVGILCQLAMAMGMGIMFAVMV